MRRAGEERRAVPRVLVAVRLRLRGGDGRNFLARARPVAALLVLILLFARAARLGVARTLECVVNSTHYLSPIRPERRNAAPTSSTSGAPAGRAPRSSRPSRPSRIAKGEEPSPCE